MNSTNWLHYFRHNRLDRAEPEWHLPSPYEEKTRRELARSLGHFQLGESGEGRNLLKEAERKTPHDTAYLESLRLFLAEEHEHARLLAKLVERFGGQLVARHWTHSAFRLLRRAVGLDFEIQVLVTAELVGTAYYRVLGRRSRDPVLEQACALFLTDEMQHVAFHIDRLATLHARMLPIERFAWQTQFQFLFLGVLNAAWIDHRACLLAVGANRAEFISEGRAECVALLSRVEGSMFSRGEKCLA